MHRTRFPGLADGWARLDGPAGTQMVDDAIEAMAAWMRSGDSANQGGVFRAGERTDAVVEQARDSVAALLGASAQGVVFGPSMTALTMRFSAAIGRSQSLLPSRFQGVFAGSPCAESGSAPSQGGAAP